MIRLRKIISYASVAMLALIGACEPGSTGRVLNLEELTYPQIEEIDRERSMFFLTFGNLEEHGPHIPIGSDTYQAAGVRDRLIARLQEAYPEYDLVLVPVIPLGEGGANDLAHEFTHVGTYAVRYRTLRDVAIDMGSAIAANGFRHIFLIHSHGSPLHNIAFTEAAAFVSERYDSNMVNITSLAYAGGFYSDDVVTEHLGPGWQEEIGITGHSGVAETSANLYLHDLVDPMYRELEPFIVPDFPSIFEIHEREGWQGYWSDPSQATAALGEDLINDMVERSYQIAVASLAGEDLSVLPVYPDGAVEVPERYLAREAEIAAWLSSRLAQE